MWRHRPAVDDDVTYGHYCRYGAKRYFVSAPPEISCCPLLYTLFSRNLEHCEAGWGGMTD